MRIHIVDLHERKLRQFKGEKGKVSQQFVEAYPEEASYFERTDKNEQPGRRLCFLRAHTACTRSDLGAAVPLGCG